MPSSAVVLPIAGRLGLKADLRTVVVLEAAVADFSAVLEQDPNHVKAAYSRAACRNALS